MSPWAILKQSSPSILLKSGIQRFPYHAAGGPSQSSSKQRKESTSTFAAFLTSVSGAVAGSSLLGFWVWSLSSSSSSFSAPSAISSFADWTATKTMMEKDDNPPEHAPLRDKQTKYLFRDSYRRRVFFNYEKRMRMRSSPEKVFEYFASVRSPEGEVFMTPADLMRAIVPVFPPSNSNIVREGCLRGEKFPDKMPYDNSTFFMLFDIDNDGLISFSEYIFFVTLLSIPESSFNIAFKMFDLDHNGEIDREEFKKVMGLMRSHNRQGASHRDGKRNGLVGVGNSVENGGLLEYFFGKDGNKCLQHDKFVKFFKDLNEEVCFSFYLSCFLF